MCYLQAPKHYNECDIAHMERGALISKFISVIINTRTAQSETVRQTHPWKMSMMSGPAPEVSRTGAPSCLRAIAPGRGWEHQGDLSACNEAKGSPDVPPRW